mmetsp:Transcript_14060/g.41207  ORF Transcript_14060/g.41207 Transcript_14060/m.41207 type:complete len:208 (+) Transcript_14060:238-861(+)
MHTIPLRRWLPYLQIQELIRGRDTERQIILLKVVQNVGKRKNVAISVKINGGKVQVMPGALIVFVIRMKKRLSRTQIHVLRDPRKLKSPVIASYVMLGVGGLHQLYNAQIVIQFTIVPKCVSVDIEQSTCLIAETLIGCVPRTRKLPMKYYMDQQWQHCWRAGQTLKVGLKLLNTTGNTRKIGKVQSKFTRVFLMKHRTAAHPSSAK